LLQRCCEYDAEFGSVKIPLNAESLVTTRVTVSFSQKTAANGCEIKTTRKLCGPLDPLPQQNRFAGVYLLAEV
jgi:hypothetical protein